MIRQFFRQAWTMMKQQRLFTGMYLIGTAVSIALAMTLFIIFYIKLGPIYPEYNRQRMVVIERTQESEKNDVCTTARAMGVSEKFCNLLKSEAKNIDKIALLTRNKIDVETADKSKKTEEYVANVNAEYWQVFNYRFVDGQPITKEQMNENVAVISTTLAKELFADTHVAGKSLNIYDTPYRIVGVVEAASGCTPITQGNIWTAYAFYNEHEFLGHYKAYITSDNIDKCMAEINDAFNRYTQTRPKNFTYTMDLEKYWQNALDCDAETTPFEAMGKYLYILLAFLFIPALNLSGMISSRMDSRLDEIGIRKAYGATNGEIITQVLWENLMLTIAGTILGVALSYLVVITGSSWITAFFDTRVNDLSPREINADMLLNPTVIICIVALTFVLNIASALVPTLIALKKDIIQSLYHRR
ncbi:MAG: FtsX-like permease family protein [Bacteroidaceae bacterium]|nr:FtsX-like permease family protein [Bacteroidaceae bacterium]